MTTAVRTTQRAYPAYKDSGIEWLGEIPEHWKTISLRWLLQTGSGDYISGTQVSPECVDGFSIPVIGGNGVMAYTDQYNTESHTIVVGRVGAHCGNVHLVEQACWVTDNALRVRLQAPDVYPLYLYRLLTSLNLNDSANRNAQPLITGEMIKSRKIALPPLPEQEAIARFLDHKTAQIDALIAKKEALLARLANKRTALISHAVTQGLDPTVPMRDSGIEWLGEIPAHWIPSRIKYFSRRFNGATPNTNNNDYWEDGSIPWLASGKVNEDIVTAPSKWITEQALKECPLQIAPRGSVIIGMVGQGRTRGMSAYLGIDTTINQNMAAIVPGKKLNGRFLHLFLQQAYQQIRDHGRGANQPALNVELVSDIPIVLPPIQEQQEIVQKLELELQKLLELNGVIQSAIDKLKQYRTALITNAVTGKIDVREAGSWATQAPTSS